MNCDVVVLCIEYFNFTQIPHRHRVCDIVTLIKKQSNDTYSIIITSKRSITTAAMFLRIDIRLSAKKDNDLGLIDT